DLEEDLRGRLPLEGRTPGQGPVCDDAQSEEIRPVCHRRAVGLLGRHVVGCAYDLVHGQRLLARDAGDTEVEDLPEVAARRQEEVARLEIAVNDARDARRV